MGYQVRQLTAADWAELRATRLRALTEAPYAFASNLDRELAFDEDRWRNWPVIHAVFFAEADGEPVAMAGGCPEDGGVELIAVWAAPETRGTGAGAAVVDAVVTWARGRGEPRVTAWVLETNERAWRFYARLGFTPTGRDEPHAHDASLREVELEFPLA